MKTLSKYFLKEHLLPFVGGLAIILFVLVMDFILDILNMIISKGVSPIIVLKLFTFNIAWMLALAVPMACLLAGLMAFGRLSEDGEITAATASGVSLPRLMLLPLAASILLSLAMVFFSDRVLPDANFEAKMLLGDIKRQKPTLALKENVFIGDFPGIGLRGEKVNSRNGEISGITIYDQKDRRIPRVIRAESGKVSYSEETDAFTLDLHNGVIHEIDPDDPSKYTRVDFDRQTIRFSDVGLRLERRSTAHRGDRELSIGDMRARIATKDTAIAQSYEAIRSASDRAFRAVIQPTSGATAGEEGSSLRFIKRAVKAASQSISAQMSAIEAHKRIVRKYLVEIHKKITLPFACVFFLLVGAPVGVWARKGGIGMAIGVGLGFFVIYWAFLIGGEELADRGFVAPWLAMWMPNFVLFAIATSMLYRTVWSSRFRGFGSLFRLQKWLSNLFRRRRFV